jgi:hypothetical protein
VHWNRNLIRLAISSGLNVRQTARFFALVHTSAADALIAGFNAKYFFRSWRPRTAIPRADTDGNPDTDSDPSWTPLLNVNHPEYPSAPRVLFERDNRSRGQVLPHHENHLDVNDQQGRGAAAG